jgi:TonB family protein
MLTYFLQVNLCWLLFYGLYYALLSRETFFKLNRIYLIMSLLGGLTIPLAEGLLVDSISKVEILAESPLVDMVQPIAMSVAEFQQTIEANYAQPQASTWALWSVLACLYGLGMAFFLVKFSIGLYKIFQLYTQGEKQPQKGFKLVNTEGVKTPFSFFNCIFINNKIVQNADFQQIIAHEKAHVQQKHSFDIVGLEILRGVFWVSPLVHLYTQSLRNVHEYLADAAVLCQRDSYGAITEKKQYGRLLISQTVCANGLTLVNHFNFSQLKKRIIMMTRNPSKRQALAKYILALPVFVLLVSFLASPENAVMTQTAAVSQSVMSNIETIEVPFTTPVENTIIENTVKNELIKAPLNKDSAKSLSILVLPNGNVQGSISAKEMARHTEMLGMNDYTSTRQPYSIISFTMTKTSTNVKAEKVENQTGKFNTDVLRMVKTAQVGDVYVFSNIKMKSDKGETLSAKDTRIDINSMEGGVQYQFNMPQSYTASDVAKMREPDKNGIYTIVEQQPEYPEGLKAMFGWIQSTMKYPEEALKAGVEGTVYIGFVIEKDGSMTNMTVKRGIGSGCNEEAMRILKTTPNWKPGMHNGKIVRVAYTVPIQFKLPK